MPFPASTTSSLELPDGQFNADGLAVLFLSGSRAGGDWMIAASAAADSRQLGEFQTSADESRKQRLLQDPRYPDLAIESAFTWPSGQARDRGWRVFGFECLNGRYGPGEPPYFCLAQAVIANAAFTPAPGVAYADELTLDAVMAGQARA
jgi:hypothetical protein